MGITNVDMVYIKLTQNLGEQFTYSGVTILRLLSSFQTYIDHK